MKYRICYEKTGRLIYVSHLDMQRLLQRLLRRAGVSMMFSQGFNPHALMSFTPPLPLFASSLAEYVDVELTGKQSASEVRDALSASVPEGISIVSVECPPEGTPPLSKSFFRASYVIELATGASAEEVMSFFDAARELVIERTNKKKQLKTEDIKPRIFSFSAEDTPRGIKAECTLNFLNEALLNPFVLAGALKKNCPALGDAKVISVCKIKVE